MCSFLGKILFFKYLYLCRVELFVYMKSVFDWFLGCGGIIILVVGESWEIMIFNYFNNYNRGV